MVVALRSTETRWTSEVWQAWHAAQRGTARPADMYPGLWSYRAPQPEWQRYEVIVRDEHGATIRNETTLEGVEAAVAMAVNAIQPDGQSQPWLSQAQAQAQAAVPWLDFWRFRQTSGVRLTEIGGRWTLYRREDVERYRMEKAKT